MSTPPRLIVRGSGDPQVVFPGSFDPFTRGHNDIVRRALTLFSTVTVAVLAHPQKVGLFSVDERIKLIEAEFVDCADRVRVMSFSGLLVDFAQKIGARVVIRGLRAVSDYDYETQMALMNKSLNGDIETLFLVAREENSYISSTIVKQVAMMGGDVSRFVSPFVLQALVKKYASKHI
jgi:pantetheine-phosphate adenylyltransferase